MRNGRITASRLITQKLYRGLFLRGQQCYALLTGFSKNVAVSRGAAA